MSCKNILKGHTSNVTGMTLVNSETLASCGGDHTVKLWNLTTGQIIKQLDHFAWRLSIVLDNNQEEEEEKTILASYGGDHTITLWNLKNGQLIQNLQAHTGEITSLISLSSKSFISGSTDNTIKVWYNLKVVKTLHGHAGGVTCLILLNDNETLISGSLDTTIKVWNISKGDEEIKTLQGHTDWITCLVILNNNDNKEETLISGSFDNTILVWNLTSGQKQYSNTSPRRLVVVGFLVPLPQFIFVF